MSVALATLFFLFFIKKMLKNTIKLLLFFFVNLLTKHVI